MDLLNDYTLRTVAMGAITLGIVSGALGTYAVLRRQSLIGDAISHAALPGIALAFLLGGTKAPLVLMIGAVVAGWLSALFVTAVTSTTRVKYDSALGIALSVFFGFGLMLLTFIQKRPDATQAGLDKFLFGQAATLLESDVLTMALLGVVALALMMLFWKEFKLLSFDREFGASLGLPMRALDALLTTLIVLAIVVGLQTVGVVLMSAMIVAPAAAARQWTDRLGVMVALSSSFGAAAGVAGALASSTGAGLPTGPMIVLSASGVVAGSLLLAPQRGLLWRWISVRRRQQALAGEAVLLDLYHLATQHEDLTHPHSEHTLGAMRALGPGRLAPTLRGLENEEWVVQQGHQHWALTPAGLAHARRLTDERESPGEQAS